MLIPKEQGWVYRFARIAELHEAKIEIYINLDELAEDKNQVLQLVERKLPTFDQLKLSDAVANYASVATKKRFMRWLNV